MRKNPVKNNVRNGIYWRPALEQNVGHCRQC